MPDTLHQKADTGTSTEADIATSTRIIGADQLYNEPARQRFVQSMQPVLTLSHPNLVRTRAVRERGETVSVITDLVTAATLESLLAADPFLSLPAVQSILDQVAMALDGAHAAGVVHGALSTRSILITTDGDAMVADVGIAPAFAHAGAREAAHEPSTLPYASPEAVRNERCTEASDQYSLGVVAYELLAGYRPFNGSPAKLKRAHLGKRPAPIGKLQLGHPDEWSRAVMRMLEKSPTTRFESLADAMEQIAPPEGAERQGYRGTLGWLAQQQISGAVTPVEDEPFGSSLRAARRLFSQPRSGRRRHLATGVVGLVAVVIGGAAWWSRVPSTTLTHISTTAATTAARIEQNLAPETMPTEMTTAGASPALAAARVTPPPVAAPPSPHQAPKPVPHHETHTVTASPITPAHTTVQPAAAAPVAAAPPATVTPATTLPATVPPAAPPATVAAAADRPLQSEDRSPAIIATAPASSYPSGAPASVSAAAAPALATAQADVAARMLVDQLRRGDYRALTVTMVATSADADFLDWLRGRSGGVQFGAPGTARDVPLPDGSVEVSYSFPVVWTHASGARRTRTAAITASVRPTPSGAKVATWLLSQPFVP